LNATGTRCSDANAPDYCREGLNVCMMPLQ
jgi:hypothetical protein